MTKDNLSWNAYNESEDLMWQRPTRLCLVITLNLYRPIVYATNKNRIWCKENSIRMTAATKGKPVKKSAYQKAKSKKEYAERNAIEGRIGNAKQAYSLNEIKAKLKSTSQTWIAATLFVLNLSRAANLMGTTF